MQNGNLPFDPEEVEGEVRIGWFTTLMVCVVGFYGKT